MSGIKLFWGGRCTVVFAMLATQRAFLVCTTSAEPRKYQTCGLTWDPVVHVIVLLLWFSGGQCQPVRLNFFWLKLTEMKFFSRNRSYVSFTFLHFLGCDSWCRGHIWPKLICDSVGKERKSENLEEKTTLKVSQRCSRRKTAKIFVANHDLFRNMSLRSVFCCSAAILECDTSLDKKASSCNPVGTRWKEWICLSFWVFCSE